MIYTHVPYDLSANLGAAYNRFMCLLAPDDWAIFLDHDAMPTTGQWFRQFAEAIAFLPDAGAIVAMTNRCARSWQRCGPVGDDMAEHRRFGAERAKLRELVDVTDSKGFGGVMFAVSVAAWHECGGFANGLGCVDHSLHHRLRAVGRRIWLHFGICSYHWRHNGGPDPTLAHPKAPGCSCMTIRETPQSWARISLPC